MAMDSNEGEKKESGESLEYNPEFSQIRLKKVRGTRIFFFDPIFRRWVPTG
jgi:hypothetical protein